MSRVPGRAESPAPVDTRYRAHQFRDGTWWIEQTDPPPILGAEASASGSTLEVALVRLRDRMAAEGLRQRRAAEKANRDLEQYWLCTGLARAMRPPSAMKGMAVADRDDLEREIDFLSPSMGPWSNVFGALRGILVRLVRRVRALEAKR